MPGQPVPSPEGEPTARDRLQALQEQAWVLMSQRGDSRAFWNLVGAYERRLLYFVRRFVPDSQRALDVVQNVWLTVFRRLITLRQPEAFRAWLYQVAHDQIVRLVRSELRNRKVEMAARETAPRESTDPPLGAENAELVHRGLAALSVEHREVLTLRFLEDMRLDEIAQATRCNVGTVKSRLHYAKLAMRQEVERLSHE